MDKFKGKIVATIGYAFNQTHPEAIQRLLSRPTALRVFRKINGVFHPKLYFFADGNRYAVFVGSSNFTYAGFYANFEANVLVEGVLSNDSEDICDLHKTLERWRDSQFSFTPDEQWLNRYRKDYKRDREAERKARIDTEALEEEHFAQSWLQNADWHTYHREITKRVKEEQRKIADFHYVLDAAAQKLPLPWKRSYFADPEKRRIIGGIRPYGHMGHVFAAGSFAHLVKSRKQDWTKFVSTVNQIAKLNPPIAWGTLENLLGRLVGLGNTMKVWGRILALNRPDLYCSVSSLSFRGNLAKTLNIPQRRLEDVEGYIQLLKFLHSSPWFNSKRPLDHLEAAIWDRRVAFIDGIFWSRTHG